MYEKAILNIIEIVLDILSEKGHSDDLLTLLSKLELCLDKEPSFIRDLITETMLACNSNKIERVTSYPIDYIKKAVEEYKEKGSTYLLEQNRNA